MLDIVILAAGKGSRMHSSLPKILHHLAGEPLLGHVIATAQQLIDHHGGRIRVLQVTELSRLIPLLKVLVQKLFINMSNSEQGMHYKSP